MKRLIGGSLAALAAMASATAAASPDPNDSTCTGVAPTTVNHDLIVIQNSLATAAPWKIGTPGQSFCTNGADRVGHDIVIRSNANNVDVSNNAPATLGDVGHDLTIVGNSGGVTANGNHAGHDCSQSNNHPYSGSGNTADHSVDSCNSSNS